MGIEDKERLQKEMQAKVLFEMAGENALNEFIVYTLNNFSYRYLESETTGLLPVMTEKQGSQWIYRVEARESNLSQALKTTNPTTKSGIISMAKSFPKKEAPHVYYELIIVARDINEQGGGSFTLSACSNWNFPSFERENGLHHKKVLTLKYQDILELRNNLARELDDVCSVF